MKTILKKLQREWSFIALFVFIRILDVIHVVVREISLSQIPWRIWNSLYTYDVQQIFVYQKIQALRYMLEPSVYLILLYMYMRKPNIAGKVRYSFFAIESLFWFFVYTINVLSNQILLPQPLFLHIAILRLFYTLVYLFGTNIESIRLEGGYQLIKISLWLGNFKRVIGQQMVIDHDAVLRDLAQKNTDIAEYKDSIKRVLDKHKKIRSYMLRILYRYQHSDMGIKSLLQLAHTLPVLEDICRERSGSFIGLYKAIENLINAIAEEDKIAIKEHQKVLKDMLPKYLDTQYQQHIQMDKLLKKLLQKYDQSTYEQVQHICRGIYEQVMNYYGIDSKILKMTGTGNNTRWGNTLAGFLCQKI